MYVYVEGLVVVIYGVLKLGNRLWCHKSVYNVTSFLDLPYEATIGIQERRLLIRWKVAISHDFGYLGYFVCWMNLVLAKYKLVSGEAS